MYNYLGIFKNLINHNIPIIILSCNGVIRLSYKCIAYDIIYNINIQLDVVYNSVYNNLFNHTMLYLKNVDL